MRITRVDVHQVAVVGPQSWVFVEVLTDEGICGLGEMNPSAPREDCLQAVQQMAEAIMGRESQNIAAITADLGADTLDRAGIHALSAIEQGLWDILGKSLNAPVHALLGGRCHNEIHVYANITRGTYELTPEAFARSAERAVADGFDAVKLAPFGGELLARDREAGIRNGIHCAHASRDAIGADIDLMLDCYGIFSVDEALQIAAGVCDLNLFWLEEPVAEDDVEGYRRVKGETGLRLAGGERLMLRRGFWPALETNLFDVAMPDVTIVGGVGELSKVADMAAARGICTAPHGPFGPVINAVQAQVMIAQPDFLILEYAWGQVPWRPDLIFPQEEVRDSRLHVTDAPGFGVELNRDVVATHLLAT